jgi:hypothetical protein
LQSDAKLLNVDGAILAMAQLVQPCESKELLLRVRPLVPLAEFDQRQLRSRLVVLQREGFLWARADKQLLVTPKGHTLSKMSLSPKDRDKFRLLLLNKSRYK